MLQKFIYCRSPLATDEVETLSLTKALNLKDLPAVIVVGHKIVTVINV